ncbi:hypothetical protein P691DRAFT_25775 [Macrolepiota fuliginosa MF-IS2]|uniref:Uncharacterized protein n=1 Tax=Macrolepiota fuliginosa MF-IS2 TaxID=1400762 RepID=A0A9P6C9Z4_9AGAR|nr:hypothetical protein P691DRAFT_25775 [Macrolepiota fuliginosa MF-IS2]
MSFTRKTCDHCKAGMARPISVAEDALLYLVRQLGEVGSLVLPYSSSSIEDFAHLRSCSHYCSAAGLHVFAYSSLFLSVFATWSAGPPEPLGAGF